MEEGEPSIKHENIEYTCNRSAVLIHTIVGVVILTYFFQHLFGEYMLWLAHGTPSLLRVNLQVALPVTTIILLCWSARPRITKPERLLTCLLLVVMGCAYIALMRWTDDEMRLVSELSGAACMILSVGLIFGEYCGFAWLTHLWSRAELKVKVPPSIMTER